MPRVSFEGFRDRARRPRYIIWTISGALVAVLLIIVALGVTSTYWFCANGCHKVQDDSIEAYNRSSHAEVSCMACHMPPNADPVTFLLHKAEALGELYLTVTNRYELPLNPGSELAIEMDSGHCTQCHGPNRPYTPGEGIIIDHAIHTEEDVACPICHNRVAHPEDFELKLKDPTTGEPNRKHDDFMTMTACFRCHSQEDDGRAPGACEACHPADFELKPANHLEAGFYAKGGDSAGHAEMAVAAREGSGEGTETAVPPAEEETHAGEAELPPVSEVFYCGTCHAEGFCT
ncbi:MAG: NapC/NirT family cytochrome c, partial [Coriobacteriia bacterium]|nr:NapC/NirT family cytochrome c [Coriobacteriia bacterium]